MALISQTLQDQRKVPAGVHLIGSTAMASDADWVEDVRRWYFASRRPPEAGAPRASVAPSAEGVDADMIGYEAADPSLQSPNWPDAPAASPTPGFSE
jgi:hypothetical protein